jgi:hypothetical protein
MRATMTRQVIHNKAEGKDYDLRILPSLRLMGCSASMTNIHGRVEGVHSVGMWF